MKNNKIALALAALLLVVALPGCGSLTAFTIGQFDDRTYSNEYFA